MNFNGYRLSLLIITSLLIIRELYSKKRNLKLNEKNFNSNVKPVIGVVVNPYPINTNDTITQGTIFEYYKQWIYEIGAEMVPLFPWYSDETIDHLLSSLNGIILQGGMRNLKLNEEFERFSAKLYHKNLEKPRDEQIPFLGICQGFQLLHAIVAKDYKVISHFNAMNISMPEYFDRKTLTDNSLYKFFTSENMYTLRNENSTVHFHGLGVSPSAYDHYAQLRENFIISSTGYDLDNKEFVDFVYGRNSNVYALQYHPEVINVDNINHYFVKGLNKTAGAEIEKKIGLGYFALCKENLKYNQFDTKEFKKFKAFSTLDIKAKLIDNRYSYLFSKE